MNEAYDLVVIGAGSAGLTAVALAKQLGARVALTEKNRTGGDCTWTGCVPSKTLLKVARVAHQMRSADQFGLAAVEPVVNLKLVMSHVQDVVAQVYQPESPDELRAEGIDFFQGEAHFLDSHTLVTGEATLTARHFLLCTGANPFVPRIAGLDAVDYLTYENIWALDDLPRHLLILGGGPIGCEMAQAFGRLGARITLLEGSNRILPNDDYAASQVLSQVFSSEGIDLRMNFMVERAWQDKEGIHLAAGEHEFVGDALLVAVGRRPEVSNLGLKEASVDHSPRGIKVDEHLRTSQHHIFAAGDCIGSYQFTHYAGWQAAVAVRNALLPGGAKGIKELVPWATFTDPEVAQAGLIEAAARKQHGDDVMTCKWPMARVDRAIAEGDTSGFMKLIHKKDGELLGITIVAARAGEMIHEWIVALDRRLKVGDLSRIIHIYPTYSTASMQGAAEIRISQLLSGASGRVVRRLVHLLR